jgi:hypothetical protein
VSIIVSYSEVYKFQTCQRQYFYNNILGKHPIIDNEAMATGTKGHKLLQTFYTGLREGMSKEESLEAAHHKAQKISTENGGIDFGLLKAWTLVANYIRATDFTAEAIIVEDRFLLPASALSPDPIFQDVQIGFTPDLVLRRKGNKSDVEDAKFVQRSWSKSKLNRFPQAKLYQIFLEKMGYEVSRSVIRFFNFQTNKVFPQYYTLGNAERLNLIHDFMSGVKDVVRYKTLPAHLLPLAPRTMNYTNCQYCPYEFPCSLEAEGKDASKTLATQYKQSNYDYTR